ncbi:hypothetical protein [Desulfosporosinus youngiae]|uniref:hypothetical protein n=1 Tax=Desulfosporosinus youngiae TaxID=339862 RepID=UPI0005AB7B02|nr:hypothetical protein [Desulfosporosinus youngiae]
MKTWHTGDEMALEEWAGSGNAEFGAQEFPSWSAESFSEKVLVRGRDIRLAFAGSLARPVRDLYARMILG